MLAAALLLAGCATTSSSPPAPVVQQEPKTKADLWQEVANSSDVDRIRRLGAAWSAALADARSAGARGEINAEGALLKPDAALPRPAPTPGKCDF